MGFDGSKGLDGSNGLNGSMESVSGCIFNLLFSPSNAKLVRSSSAIICRALMSLSLKSEMSFQYCSITKSLIKSKMSVPFEAYLFVIFVEERTTTSYVC